MPQGALCTRVFDRESAAMVREAAEAVGMLQHEADQLDQVVAVFPLDNDSGAGKRPALLAA